MAEDTSSAHEKLVLIAKIEQAAAINVDGLSITILYSKHCVERTWKARIWYIKDLERFMVGPVPILFPSSPFVHSDGTFADLDGYTWKLDE